MTPTASLIVRAIACPKTELHLHLEGTLEPELMFELARRNGVSLRFESVEALRAAYDFADLQSFLDIYYEGASVLVTQSDFYDLTMAYLRRAHADNVVHVEPFFDPQTHTARGIAFDTVVSGIVGALRDGERELGITWRPIMCFLRDQSAASASEMLDAALAHTDVIAGVGLDSAEVGNPPEKFAEVFERARSHGFRAVAHAGEEGTADDVTRTLDVLGVVRIDHGVRAMDDLAVVARLVHERVPLTVCPLSNLKLRVVRTMENHNLGQMLEAGVLATVNSDDPAYFGGYVGANYAAVIEALRLDEDQVRQLLTNSFEASWLTDDAKATWLERVATEF